jgi:hypothetical protein
LFIDEVLGVGDFRFRQKCLGKIREMRARSAFVLVSHSMGDIARFCNRVIVMHKGRAAFTGPPKDAIAFYQTLDAASEPRPKSRRPVIANTVDRPEFLDSLQFSWIGADGSPNGAILEGRPFGAKVSFLLKYAPQNLVVGLPVYDQDGEVITGFATDVDGAKISAGAFDRVDVVFKAPYATLNPNRYRAAIGITDGTEFLHMKELPDLVILPAGRKSWGVASVPFSIDVATSKVENASAHVLPAQEVE